MMASEPWAIGDREILAARPPKAPVDPQRPYAWLVENECSPEGLVEPVATVFLTNKECPFRCLMCDLWRNTTDERVVAGVIPGQIDWALNQLPPLRHIKLYNSGSFFDPGAIPANEYDRIAALVREFRTVIVESHPRFINDNTIIDQAGAESLLGFGDMLLLQPGVSGILRVHGAYVGEGANLAGGTGSENVYFIDGINMTEPVKGSTSADLPYNFMREIEVKTGGYEAEYASALGGLVNVVTQSGDNEFSGQAIGFLTNNAL